MRKIVLFFALLCASAIHAQLVPNGNSGSTVTFYTNGAPNDPIYIWCGNTIGATQGSLTATTVNGTGPYTFNWYFHDQGTSSWQPYSVEAGVTTSTISNLPSDGYRVQITDATNTVVDCFVAWVWNLNTTVTASASLSACNNASLNGVVNTTGSFSYYNPPPPESLINATTDIQVCFNANHTFVSDLAFYLVGPASCGSPLILLSPNPGAIGEGSTCNNGNDVSNLCFTTTPAGNLDVCNPSPTTLSGTYSTYGPLNTAINWSSLIGCNAAAGGWRVQIYDCIGADVGALTSADITFSNLTSICGSPTSISYSSGSINSAINDNSCTAGSASIFQVPISPTLNTPITIYAVTTLQWTSSVGITNSTSANASAPGVPDGTTSFMLTATTVYADAHCQNSAGTSVTVVHPVVDGGPDQAVCNGENVTLSGSGAQSYTWDNGVVNGVPFQVTAAGTYVVTGTASNGCTDTDTVNVTLGTPPTIGAGTDQNICLGTPVTLSGTGGVSYVWSNGVTDNVAFTPELGSVTYTVTGTDADGCQNTAEVTVLVVPVPVADVNSSSVLSGYPGLSVTFTNASQNANAYSIDFGNGQTGSSTVLSDTYTSTYNTPGLYDVVLTASNGICQDTSIMYVFVIPFEPLGVEIPNVFTPDGDNVNDEFFLDVTNGTEINVIIVNRWQEKMFEINDFTTHWNGGGASEGTYFFTYTIKGKDGTTQTGQGFVELFRKK